MLPVPAPIPPKKRAPEGALSSVNPHSVQCRLVTVDRNAFGLGFLRHNTQQIDTEQTVGQARRLHFDVVSQAEGQLEGPLGDALVQVIDDLVTLLEREMVRWTAGLHLFQLMMVALVIGATIVFWMMSYWEVLYPLERLEGGMAEYSSAPTRSGFW